MSEQECTGVIQNSPLRSFFLDAIVPVYLIFITFTQKNEMTGETNESMIINKNEIAIKPIQEEDIPLFDKWLDKEYITSNPQLSSSASFLRLNVLSSLN